MSNFQFAVITAENFAPVTMWRTNAAGNRVTRIAQTFAEYEQALVDDYQIEAAPTTTTTNRPRREPMIDCDRTAARETSQNADQRRATVPEWATIGMRLTCKVTGFARNSQFAVTKVEASVPALNGQVKKFAVYERAEHPDLGGTFTIECRQSDTAGNGKSWFTVI